MTSFRIAYEFTIWPLFVSRYLFARLVNARGSCQRYSALCKSRIVQQIFKTNLIIFWCTDGTLIKLDGKKSRNCNAPKKLRHDQSVNRQKQCNRIKRKSITKQKARRCITTSYCRERKIEGIKRGEARTGYKKWKFFFFFAASSSGFRGEKEKKKSWRTFTRALRSSRKPFFFRLSWRWLYYFFPPSNRKIWRFIKIST